MKPGFQAGIEVLLGGHKDWLAGRRVGLVSHLAAVDARGRTSAWRLWQDPDVNLVALFGPEHGFFGKAGAGEKCSSIRHPEWGIPIHSLYGRTQKPTRAMLRGLDVLVFDIQDLGARPYTYVSTLRLVLEAAAESGVAVVVADRPVPLPCTVDGPMTATGFSSFVSMVPTPLVYGLTPGEMARWLNRRLRLGVELKVAGMAGYCRQGWPGRDWPPWAPPSPAIRSWECGRCFPVTVCFEGIGSVNHARRTRLAFQAIGAPWMRGAEVAERLTALKLPGVRFVRQRYNPDPAEKPARFLDGVRLVVTDPDVFRPVLTGISMVWVLQALYGKDRVWTKETSRPEFFDKLMGTDSVRLALQDGGHPRRIAAGWQPALEAFGRTRLQALLYEESGRLPRPCRSSLPHTALNCSMPSGCATTRFELSPGRTGHPGFCCPRRPRGRPCGSI